MQLKSGLGAGVTLTPSSGDGSQNAPFQILIDESVSLETSSLALSQLFSNVTSVEDLGGAIGSAQLDSAQRSIIPKPASKLSLKLNGSNDEKYAVLYFQDSARLTKAVQSGEAVLSPIDRGKVAKDVEVTVTIYKKNSSDTSWSVDLGLLFDYEADKFDVTAYKDGDARFSQGTEINNLDQYTVTATETIQLVFTLKGDVDPLLYPERSQLLKLIPDEKVISSLDFKDSAWGDDSKWSDASRAAQNRGEYPEDARVLESVWDEALNLLSYVEADNSENLTVKLYKADNLNLIPPTGGTVAEGGTLTSPEFDENDSDKYKFEITGESPSAIFELSTADSDSVFGKKLYVKVSTLKKDSSFALATLPNNRTSSGTGVDFDNAFAISGTFPANTAVNLKTLVDESSASATGNLTYTTVTSANDALPGSITNPESALNDQDGTSVVFRVVDSGSLEVKAKTIFLKLSFANATLKPNAIYTITEANDGSSGKPILVPKIAQDASLTLSDLIAPYSGTVTYSLEREGETSITLPSTTPLEVGEKFGLSEVLIAGDTAWTIKVSGTPPGETTATKVLYFEVTFTKAASTLGLVEPLPDSRTASGNGEAYATPFVISGSFATNTAVNLKTLVNETSASAAANLTYTTVTSANDQSSGSISNPAEALNTQVAGTSVVVRVVDSGSTTVAAKTIFLKLSFKTASSFALVATLPDDRTASGNGEAYATPFVISGSFAVETAVNLKTLVDEASASAAANLTYTTVTSANDQSPGSISNPAEALNTQAAGTSVVVRVVDSGSTTVAAKTIFLKLSFKTASSFALVATLPDDRTASGNGEAYATPFVISGSFAAETAVNLKTLVDEASASAAANLTYTTVTSANDQSPGSISNPAEALNTQAAGTSVVVRVVDSGSTTVAAKTIFLKLSFKTASSFALVATLPDDRTASGNGEAYATPFVISGSFAVETAVNLKTLVDEDSAADNLTYTTVTSANDQSPGSISNPAEALNTQAAGTSVVVRVVDSGSTTVAAKTIFLKLSFKTASSFALVATLPDDRTASGNGEAYATPFVINGSFAAETAVNLKTLVDEASASAAANLTYTTVTSANDQSPGSISNPAEALNTQAAGTSVVVRVVDSGSTTVAAKTIFLKLSFKTASSFALVATLPDDRTASGNGEAYATPFVISGSFAAKTAVNLKTLVDEASAAANLTYTTVTSANDQSPGSISNPAEALNTQAAGTSVVVRVVDSGSTTVAAKTIFLKLSFKTASSFALVATLPDDRTASGNGEAYATPFVISGTFPGNTAVNLQTLVDESSASATDNLTYTTVTSATDTQGTKIDTPAEALGNQAGKSVVVRVYDKGSDAAEAKTIFLQLSFAKAASKFGLVETLPNSRTASGNGEAYTTPFVISGSFAAETAVNLKTLVDETSASAAANLTYTTVTSANDQSPGSISNPAEALNTQVAGTSVVVRVVDSGSTTVAAKTIFLKLSFKTASSFALVATLPDDRTASGNGEAYATPFVISGSFAAETAINLKTLVDETSASAAANLTYTTVTSANDQSPGSISNPAEALNTQVAGTSVVVRVVDSGSTTVAAKTIFLKLSFKTASSFALVATLPDDRTASGNGEAYATPFVISGSFAVETAVNLKTLVDEASASAAANLTYTTVTSANDQSPGSISNPAEALNTQAAGTSVVVRVVDSGSTTVAAKTIFLKLSFKTASSFALVATLPDDRTASGNGEAYATPFVISGSFAAETAVNLKTLVNETSASAAANLTYTTVTSANDQSPGSISNPAEALNTQVAGTSVVVRVVDSGSTTVAAKTIFLKLSFKTASSFALVATLPDDRTASGNGEAYATPFVISGSFAVETAVNLKTLVNETSASAAANLTYTTVTSANDQSPGSISNPAEALNTQAAGTSVVVRVVDSGSTTVAAKTIFLKLSFKTASSFALVATLPDDRTASGNGEAYATPFVISGSFAAETAVNLKTLVNETSASAAANLTYTTVTSANDQSPGSISNPAEALNTQVAGTSVVVRVVDSGSTTVAAKTIFLKLSFKTASSFALVATLPDDRTASGNGEAYATPFVISGSFAVETAVNLKTLVDEASASAAANLTYTTVTSANDQSPGSISNPAEALNTQAAGTSVVVRVVDSGSTTVAAKTIFLKLSFKTASSFALVATLPDDRTASGNGEAYATPFVISGSFAAETAVNLKTLVNETSASAAANLTYTTVTSANDQSPGSISNPAEALNTQVAGTSVVVRVVDSGSTTVAAKTIFLKLSFKTASSFALVATLPDDRTASGNGEAYATPFVISGSFAAETAVNLKTLVDETSASAVANLTYTTVTSANDQSPGSISNPAEALNTQVAGTSVVVRVVDSGSTTVAAKTIFLKLSFKTASSFALVATLPDDRTASGNGEAYATPFVISGSFAAETAVNLKTLVNETSASAAANLTYTTVTSANDQSPGSISNPAEALNTQAAGTSVVVRVVDSGSTTVAAKTIFLKLSFKTASSFAFQDQLPTGYDITGTGADFANAAILTVNGGTLPANTAVDLTAFFKGFTATPIANPLYETVTSASDTSPGTISNPASALANQAGKSVVVRVVDSGSTTVAANTLYLSLAFATVPPTQDNRYTTVALRSGGPEVALTGSMTAGKISFSVELLPNKEQVIYSSSSNGDEFKYLYRDFDGDGDDYDLVLFVSGTGDVSLKADLPAGLYNFSLVKALSDNGYTVEVSVTDADGVALILDDTANLSFHTIEITNNNVQAFSNPVIGADANASNRRPVRVVNNVQWAFQPAAPQVSLLGGDDFSALTTGASVGSTFFVGVSDLVAGDEFELFSATNDQTSSRNQTKTVRTGETSLEFEVSGLTHGTVYEFLVKPADSSAKLLDSPASVTVSVDTSVPATGAAFISNGPVTQGSRVNGLAGMSVTPVDPTADAFEVGDRIFLYEINADNERVAVGSETGLAHTFTTENFAEYSNTTVNPLFPALGVNLSNISFEERAYALVVEVVTPLGNKADSNFTYLVPGAVDRVFDITFDFTAPQLSFDFSDASNLVISANEALAADLKADIESGLTFTDAQGNSLSITPTATYRTGSSDYEVSLSPALSGGAVLNLAAGTVRDVAGNGNVGIQQNVFPSLLSIVASSNRIDSSSTSTNLTFNFAQEIDAGSFEPADDLEIINSSGTVITSDPPTLSKVTSSDSQTIQVTLTAGSDFDNQVRVRMKNDNQISLPGTSLAAVVEGESPLIDIDRKAPTPTVSFAATQVAPEKTIQFTLSFDEAVTGDIAADKFQVGTTGNLVDATATILLNISRTDDRTFTGTLTAPSAETTDYSLILKANAVADTYGNNNDASAAATINVVNGAVPIPSFSAPPLARHGGSTTLTISFPETVIGFELSDLSVTDVNNASTVGVNNASTVGLDTLNQTGNDYTVTLSTQDGWVSGPVTVSVAANAYQNSSNAGNSPALSYTIPVSNVLSTPTLVSVTDSTTTVNASSDTETLLLSGISVKVSVSAVAGDTLLLFLGDNPVAVATKAIATTGTQPSIDITDSSSKVNGSRLAYSVRLQDAQGNLSSVSRSLYVSFDDPSAATAPEISGPVSNASFTDDFSFGESNWAFRHGKAVGINQPSTLPGSAEINNGVLQLNDARTWQYALVTQNDLIFSTQGRVVFEATFIFGNTQNPADGIAFFSYDAGDELFHEGREYSGDGQLVVTHGRLRSLFFAVGLDEFGADSIRYAPPAANPADLSDLANPTGGNTSAWDTVPLADIWANARHRLRITVENRSVLVERADVDTNGVVDESSWSTMLQRSFPDTAYVPDNIKIGFSSATGAQRNYHAVDDVSVNAELFVPYTVGATPVQASPSGVTLTAGTQAGSSNSLAISGISVQINSGYQTTDSLTFSGDSTLFTSTLSGNKLTISAAAEQSPTTAQFLAALNAINFSTTAAGDRTLNWQVFAGDPGSEITSQSYSSEIRVFSAGSIFAF